MGKHKPATMFTFHTSMLPYHCLVRVHAWCHGGPRCSPAPSWRGASAAPAAAHPLLAPCPNRRLGASGGAQAGGAQLEACGKTFPVVNTVLILLKLLDE
jgi:hypothetical protein